MFILNRKLFILAILGFSSGLPLALVGATLQAWLAVSGVDLMAIGMLTLIAQPYVYKFCWAPLFDRFPLALLGRRRGWILLTQGFLALLIIILSHCNPSTQLGLMAYFALGIAFVSASQDIVIDAYRAEVLGEAERGLGAAWGVAGYRIAMITSGGLALVFAERWGWANTYMLMSLGMFAGMVACILGPEPNHQPSPPLSLRATIIMPFKQFLNRDKAIGILLFIFCYKLAESFTSTTMGSLVTTYLLNELHFSLSEVGLINKIVGVIATLAGLFLGGIIMTRISLYKALWHFGILQAVTNLGFVLLAIVGKSTLVLTMAVTLDNLSAGMGMSALIAYMMSLTDSRYTATQFALLTAFAGLPRILAGPVTASIVNASNWLTFFIIATLLALPALILLRYVYSEREGNNMLKRVKNIG